MPTSEGDFPEMNYSNVSFNSINITKSSHCLSPCAYSDGFSRTTPTGTFPRRIGGSGTGDSDAYSQYSVHLTCVAVKGVSQWVVSERRSGNEMPNCSLAGGPTLCRFAELWLPSSLRRTWKAEGCGRKLTHKSITNTKLC